MQNKEQTREQMWKTIADWRNSGLSQKQFCEQNNLRYHAFHYWYKRYRNTEAASGVEVGNFVPVTVNAGSVTSYVEVQLADGKKILFHQPVSVDYLKMLIA